ncbi:MAG TPA: glycosyltransferase family 39 protein [Nostocaceae cyanobacterium]|nr:glycosyltransferase family 39 protein [Nostocaceae cyanobacterium]
MLYQARQLPAVKNLFLLFEKFPQLSLLLWILPLMLFTSGENSLMAHDEALYAWRSRQMVDSGDWVAPWGNAHHKTPGFYWLMAIYFQLFGISDIVARIPSLIAGIGNVFVIYEVGKILLGQRLAYLSVAILSVEFLWLQYCRLSTPDLTTILLIFTAILALLKIEINPKYRHVLGFITGLCFGLGFTLRSFKIFLPAVALLPYLIKEHHRHHHLKNPLLYVGFIVGVIPTFVWVWLSWQRFGDSSWGELLGFVFRLGSKEQSGDGILFYFWNLPLKSFPWFFFSLLGLVILLRRPIANYQLLLVAFPITLFTELTLFTTRISHYSLGLYPFIALWASVGLDWLGKLYDKKFVSPENYGESRPSFVAKTIKNLPRNLSYVVGVLGLLLVIAGIVILAGNDIKLREYAILGLIAGLSCLLVPGVWISRYYLKLNFLTARYWVFSWLMIAWISLATAGCLGLLSDYNPDYRLFFQQQSNILKSHSVSFVRMDGKNAVLLNFYTPIHGKKLNNITELPADSYAWIYTKNLPDLSRPHQVISTIQDYRLIKVLP